jgi:predicted HTH transcriptional regulator
MINSLDELFYELRAGQLVEHRHENVQLKESWKQEAGKDLSAYANKLELTKAYLVVGVKDSGVLLPNTEAWAQQTEQTVSQHINQYLDPGQSCTGLRAVDVVGNWVIVIEVANPGAVVHWNGVAYRGSGTTKIPMEPHEVIEVTLRLPGLQDYTAQPWDGATRDEFVNHYVEGVRTKHPHAYSDPKDLFSEHALGKLGLAGKQAARLLFGSSRFRVVKFDANGTPVSNEDRGPLFALLTKTFRSELQDWCAQQLRLGTDPFPDAALREALANAVAHACYFERDADIIVETYADRVEITNLCLTESKAFANKWFSRDHHTVNRVLMEALRLGGLVDELGLGKNVIFRESIIQGKRQPEVIIENAGRFNRWRLVLYGGLSIDRHIRLLKRLNDKYPSPQKALLAFSLAIWSDQNVSHIRQYIGKDAMPMFDEVLHDLTGPVFYWEERDRLVLNRWARILLHEGKDSKQPSDQELEALFRLVSHLAMKYDGGHVTPAALRQYGEFGDSKSEMTLTSRILGRWVKQGRLERASVGKYKLLAPPAYSVPHGSISPAIPPPPPSASRGA